MKKKIVLRNNNNHNKILLNIYKLKIIKLQKNLKIKKYKM